MSGVRHTHPHGSWQPMDSCGGPVVKMQLGWSQQLLQKAGTVPAVCAEAKEDTRPQSWRTRHPLLGKSLHIAGSPECSPHPTGPRTVRGSPAGKPGGVFPLPCSAEPIHVQERRPALERMVGGGLPAEEGEAERDSSSLPCTCVSQPGTAGCPESPAPSLPVCVDSSFTGTKNTLVHAFQFLARFEPRPAALCSVKLGYRSLP